MRGVRRALIACAVALALAGCVLFPKQADLEQVHDSYRKEFASTFLGQPGGKSVYCEAGAAPLEGSFPNTLQAIRDYDVKYRGDASTSTERAHLVVLKAMIHLQVGNTGIARSMIDEVEAVSIAAAGDHEVRDSLFKRAFRHLVDGWEAVCDRSQDRAARLEKLLQAADGVVAVSNAQAGDGTAGKPATDEGAIYLATTAAIFYRHAFQVRIDRCMFGSAKGGDEPCRKQAAAKGDHRKAIDAIGKFLSPDERKAASAGKPGAEWIRVVPRGRVQYVQWYFLLSAEAAEAAQ